MSVKNRLLTLFAVLTLGALVVSTTQAEEIEYDNGDVYVGDVSYGGEPHGYGVYRWANGRIYVGEWFFGKADGRGKVAYPDGRLFEGEHSFGHAHGHGVMSWPDGTRLEARYVNDEPHGIVKLYFPDRDVYEGYLGEGGFDGHGVYTTGSGIRTEGLWRDDVLPYGVSTSPEGWRYVGEFNDEGQFQGKGVFTYADGSSLVGEWRGDNLHGHAVYTSAVGRHREEREHRDGWLISAKETAQPSPASSPSPSPQQLQSALAALGFDPGPVDGKIGPKTREAIERWQASVGENSRARWTRRNRLRSSKVPRENKRIQSRATRNRQETVEIPCGRPPHEICLPRDAQRQWRNTMNAIQ